MDTLGTMTFEALETRIGAPQHWAQWALVRLRRSRWSRT